MRLVIQRVKHAKVEVSKENLGEITQGLLVFIGVAPEDTKDICDKAIAKLLKLRVFDKSLNNKDLDDCTKGMSYSVSDINGGLLLISQFTLLANLKKGTRPSFSKAADPKTAEPLYDYFVKKTTENYSGHVAQGRFGADMQVSLLNDGPVTLVWDID